jgi:preprotein translocase subunit SecE
VGKGMKIINRTIDFLKEVKIELTKVSWSTKEELLGATTVVIVITSLMGLFIGIIDLFLSKALSLVFK